MINEENLNKLYNNLIEEKIITTKKLNEYGFNSTDLRKLIEDKTLKKIKRGYYSLNSADKVYYYGEKLNTLKEYDKATQYFTRCLEINPNHYEACLQLLFRYIKLPNYEKALEYIDKLYDMKATNCQLDSNFYLYLLSVITKLPEKYKNYAKILNFNDFNNSFESTLQNKVRLSAYNQRFTLAKRQLKEIINQKECMNTKDIILITLIEQALDVQNKNRSEILKLLKSEDYEKVMEFLEDMALNHHLSILDNYVLILSKDLIKLNNSSLIPQINVFNTDNIFTAIDGKNYKLALELSLKYNNNINANSENNVIHILLHNINNKINELSLFSDVIDEDLNAKLRSLRNYLTKIDKEKYAGLVEDLIKMSIFQEDKEFTKPQEVLTSIRENNFSFNLAEYIHGFYKSLSQNKFEEAKIYIDIISKSSRLEQECVLIPSLIQILNNTENNLKKQKENQDSYQLYITQKLNDLYKYGIALLKPLPNNTIKYLKTIIKDKPDIASFTIGSKEQEQIVLRYQPNIKEYKDISNLLKKGSEAYSLGDYDTCINNYRQVLESIEPKAFVYAELGLAYMKKFVKGIAIEYLTIATELSKKEDNKFDFTELIASLKGLIPLQNKKPRVKMEITDFNNNLHEYYGINNLDEIVELISAGYNVEEACQFKGLNKEQTDLVFLILAKDSYAKNDFSLGDKFIKQVEKRKEKTKFVISLLEEIRKNKKFYKNRVDDNYKSLLLTSYKKQ